MQTPRLEIVKRPGAPTKVALTEMKRQHPKAALFLGEESKYASTPLSTEREVSTYLSLLGQGSGTLLMCIIRDAILKIIMCIEEFTPMLSQRLAQTILTEE